jgi:SAM-dependent methyltransferase
MTEPVLNVFQQAVHPLLPLASHEERTRQDFAKGLRGFVQQRLLPGLTPLHRKLAGDAARDGGGLADRHAIRERMVEEPYFQAYAATNRSAQELLWASVIDTIEREMPRLRHEAARLEGKVGTLTLDPTLEVPRYVTALDIHCMPGGYASDADPQQLAAGALYDRGVYLYSMGYIGPMNDDMGRSVANYIRRNLQGFAPQRILDLGCTTGHSTLPYKELFPDAEVWGIDVGGPMVRYAHLRANRLGSRAHFAQSLAERTGFPDGHFDLVVSYILHHEIPADATRAVIAEARCLTRPGGVYYPIDFHTGGPRAPARAMYSRWWDHRWNNEVWSLEYHEMDLTAEVAARGFRLVAETPPAFPGFGARHFLRT